ncbi:response regulator, partial [Bradyrhizobium sp. 30]|uniref:response regulator n=2 Tax=Bradyrhizobium TaxID=374 RepID=UPI003211C129
GGRHHLGTGGRLQIGMVGEIISESWATSIGIRTPVQNELIVLVVEDEDLIQGMVGEALSGGGFEPQIVSSGEEAVILLKTESTSYRALLTDVHLRGKLTGWEVAKQAREINPEMPVVYMTGAAADQWPSHGVPNSVLLNKPFAPAQVVTAVSQLHNQIPPSHS